MVDFFPLLSQVLLHGWMAQISATVTGWTCQIRRQPADLFNNIQVSSGKAQRTAAENSTLSASSVCTSEQISVNTVYCPVIMFDFVLQSLGGPLHATVKMLHCNVVLVKF